MREGTDDFINTGGGTDRGWTLMGVYSQKIDAEGKQTQMEDGHGWRVDMDGVWTWIKVGHG